METQSIHIFTSLSTLIALQVPVRAPGQRPTLQLISHWQDDMGAQVQEGVGDGQWEVELIGKADYQLCAHLEAGENIFPDCGFC